MRIVKIRIESFGKIKNQSLSFENGLNVICEDNGYGKSTIATFIKAMFYGLKDTKRSIEENERTRFTPWRSTEKFGGTLTFEHEDGKTYTIERFFGKKESEDEQKVINTATGKEEKFFGDCIGKTIFDLDHDAFVRCIFIPQQQIKVDAQESFAAKLSNVVENTDDTNNYQTAIKKLEDFMRKIKLLKGRGGALPDTEDDIYEKERMLNASKENQKTIEQLEEIIKEDAKELLILKSQLEQIREQINEKEKEKELSDQMKHVEIIKTSIDNLNNQHSYLSDCFSKGVPSNTFFEDSKVKAEELNNLNVGIMALKAQQDKYKNESSTISTKNNQKKRTLLLPILFFIVSIIFFTIAFFVTFRTVLWIVSAAFILLSLASLFAPYFQKKKGESNEIRSFYESAEKDLELKKSQAENARLQLQIQVSKYFDCAGDYYEFLTKKQIQAQELEKIKNELNEKEEQWKEAEQRFGKEKLKNLTVFNSSALQDLKNQRTTIIEKIERVNLELATNSEKNKGMLRDYIAPSEIEGELLQLKDKKDNLIYKYNVADKTRQALSEAKSNVTVSYLPKMKSVLKEYFRKIISTDGFEDVDIDENLNIFIQEKGSRRAIDYFSAGIKEICMFCLRLSLIDAMFLQAKPFIVLDDPFVNFDDGKLKVVSMILKKRAINNQIIYFTCHNENKTVFIGDKS